MAEETWFEKHHKTDEEKRLFAQEVAILSALEEVCRVMETENVSRADMATKLGKSRAFVTQVLRGSNNITIRTLADFAWACGRTVDIRLRKGAGHNFEPTVYAEWKESAETQATVNPSGPAQQVEDLESSLAG
ncbi:MAG: hypothetical protein A3G34_10705 [Candidatus Lindowbacteria bacterium RIFCSPLOWO2_12_FULL_62_27]|nr:MAG: hypothetical protein A3G34_10705 [Candidatus Lindowbacteria bacterium RIFCSPLOWO2_12_FULL_62_27]